MDSRDQFRQVRSVIEDFTDRTLAALPGDFGRLHYVSSLKDPATGRYVHDGLTQLYSEGSVQEGLANCHQELFSRILETPLRDQERELREYLDTIGDNFWCQTASGEKNARFLTMCPSGAPEYLHSLFCSNMEVLSAVLSPGRSE